MLHLKTFLTATAGLSLSAPATGKLVPMKKLVDPSFSTGVLGPCVGIEPEDGLIVAPCTSVITQIFNTGHAITLTSAEGADILIHLGIGTVALRGQGFQVHALGVNPVPAGTPLVTCDLDLIRKAGFSPVIVTVLCNALDFKRVRITNAHTVRRGDPLMSMRPKR